MSIQTTRDPWGHVIAGSLSGLVSCVALQPFDVIKTRMQQHQAPGFQLTAGERLGFFKTFRNVVEQESIKGLWRGTVPTFWRNIPGGALYFATLGAIRTSMARHLGDSNQTRIQLAAWENAFAGAVARGGVGALLLPLSVLKARFESNLYNYNGIIQAVSTIARKEGYKGLFSGLSATLLRDAPQAGLYVSFYEYFKHTVSFQFGLSPGIYTNFTSGITAGLLATACTHPADVVKTRSQLEPKKYGNFFRASIQLFKEDGIIGFTRGMLPRCLRKASGQAITWTFYEECLALYAKYKTASKSTKLQYTRIGDISEINTNK